MALAATLTLLAGCATAGEAADSPEAQVKARAMARWDALKKHDTATAYTFLTPSYRALHDAEYYGNSFGAAMQYKSVEVINVTCESPEKCTARIKTVATPPPPIWLRLRQDITSALDEIWLKDNGQWWIYRDLK